MPYGVRLGILFFSCSGKRPWCTSGTLSVHQMRQAAASPPEILIEALAELFPLNFLFIHSLTKALPSCRTSSSTSSRPCPCRLFMSPEEGSLVGGSWWLWDWCPFTPSSSHVSRQSIAGQHPPAPRLTFKKWRVDVRVSLLTCPPPVPSLCIFNPVTLPFLSFVVHCTSFFLLVFVTFSLLPPWGGFKVLLIHT